MGLVPKTLLPTALFNKTIELRLYLGAVMLPLKNLVIEIDITCSRDSEPNTAEVIVYNLSEANRNLITTDLMLIEVIAGYNIPLTIFRGTVAHVSHYQEGVNWITTITVGEGHKELTATRYNKAWPKGTPILTIVTDLCVALLLPFEINAVLTNTLIRGRSFTGPVKSILDELSKSYGFKWSVQMGIVQITNPLLPPLSYPKAVLLSTDTGMVGVPELFERDEKISDKIQRKVLGVRVTSRLNPEIRPGRLILIQAMQTVSRFVGGKTMEVKIPNVTANGVYICETVRYSGNNWSDGDFTAEIEADRTL